VTTLLGIKALPPRVIDGDAEKPHARRRKGVESHIEGRQPGHDRLPRLERRLVLPDLEEGAEELDDREVRCFQVRDAACFQHEAVARLGRAEKLRVQP
jgi:hypothetical protein